MKEAQGFVGVPILDTQPRTDDAGGVGCDRDRNAGQSKDDSAPDALLEEVAVEDGESKEAHEGPDTAAGLSDLKLHDGEFDDVALLKYRHPKYRKDAAGELGRQELQRKGDLVEYDLGERDGQHQRQQWKHQRPEHSTAEQRPDEAGEEDKEGGAGEEKIRPINAKDDGTEPENHQAADHPRTAGWGCSRSRSGCPT